MSSQRTRQIAGVGEDRVGSGEGRPLSEPGSGIFQVESMQEGAAHDNLLVRMWRRRLSLGIIEP